MVALTPTSRGLSHYGERSKERTTERSPQEFFDLSKPKLPKALHCYSGETENRYQNIDIGKKASKGIKFDPATDSQSSVSSPQKKHNSVKNCDALNSIYI